MLCAEPDLQKAAADTTSTSTFTALAFDSVDLHTCAGITNEGTDADAPRFSVGGEARDVGAASAIVAIAAAEAPLGSVLAVDPPEAGARKASSSAVRLGVGIAEASLEEAPAYRVPSSPDMFCGAGGVRTLGGVRTGVERAVDACDPREGACTTGGTAVLDAEACRRSP